jgi:hypothetical protein
MHASVTWEETRKPKQTASESPENVGEVLQESMSATTSDLMAVPKLDCCQQGTLLAPMCHNLT